MKRLINFIKKHSRKTAQQKNIQISINELEDISKTLILFNGMFKAQTKVLKRAGLDSRTETGMDELTSMGHVLTYMLCDVTQDLKKAAGR